MAAGKGLVGVATLLLSHGAIIDAQDALGNTALHYAAQHRAHYSLPILTTRAH